MSLSLKPRVDVFEEIFHRASVLRENIEYLNGKIFAELEDKGDREVIEFLSDIDGNPLGNIQLYLERFRTQIHFYVQEDIEHNISKADQLIHVAKECRPRHYELDSIQKFLRFDYKHKLVEDIKKHMRGFLELRNEMERVAAETNAFLKVTKKVYLSIFNQVKSYLVSRHLPITYRIKKQSN
jgi:hypothetical protein